MQAPTCGAQRVFLRALAICSLAACALLTAPEAKAQSASTLTWGVLSPTELRDRLDTDPSAGASVVFDRGLITVGPGFKFTFERHRRVQIFGPSAYRFANVEIPYHKSEKIEDIEAHTLTPDGRRLEVKSDQIYTNKAGDFVSCVFAFPEVTSGSVIEYRYKITSRNFYYLRPWAFQNSIPTEYSEMVVRLPDGFEYEAVLNNAEFVHGPDTNVIASILHKGPVREFVWYSRNLAPLVSEPCVLSLLDHRVQLDFQIVRYRDEGKVWDFVDSWADLAKQVRKVYKPLLRVDEHWPRMGVLQPGQSPEAAGARRALAKRIFQFVRDSVALSGEARNVAGGGLLSASEVFDQRRGNALEKNLLLVALLRYHGFDAYPALISRRNHLRFDPRDHRLFQFDHALAMIENGDEREFCDANTPGAWLGYLPPECQVDRAVVIGHPGLKQVVIDVPAPQADNDVRGGASITLRPDGSAFGRLEALVSGQAAYNLLRALSDRDTVKYLQEHWLPGAIPRELRIERNPQDDWAPIRLVAELEWPEAATLDAGRLFLRPSILRKVKTNPLMTSTRRYPISFETSWSEECHIEWNLPPDFELNELPPGREIVGDGFEFRSSVTKDGDRVVASHIWRVNKRDFPVTRFKDLRELFHTVQLSQRGLLVLYHDTL
jgi:transglutaminase-like putative cysteine protease